MGKIVALWGGDKLNSGFSVKALNIDKEIIKLTNKSNPKLLFIPTASLDLKLYVEDIENYFWKKLGCKIDVLYLLDWNLIKSDIENKILDSDIIFVGGGNTLMMMKIWRKFWIDNILKEAYKKNIVLSGTSAGAICWFKFGNSDSRRYKNPSAKLIKVSGLNLFPILFCPHYDTQDDRKNDLKNMMKQTPGVALAVDNCCAIIILDNKFRIISSKKNANAYKVYWKNGQYFEERINKTETYREINKLITKKIL